MWTLSSYSATELLCSLVTDTKTRFSTKRNCWMPVSPKLIMLLLITSLTLPFSPSLAKSAWKFREKRSGTTTVFRQLSISGQGVKLALACSVNGDWRRLFLSINSDEKWHYFLDRPNINRVIKPKLRLLVDNKPMIELPAEISKYKHKIIYTVSGDSAVDAAHRLRSMKKKIRIERRFGAGGPPAALLGFTGTVPQQDIVRIIGLCFPER